jgi:capsular exopolysaccharide synthesis family protein
MDGDALDLRSIFSLLRRRLWLIALVVAVALGAAGLALLALKPVYTATTLVLVDPSKKNLLDPNEQLSGSSSDSLRVDSEVELVKSETVLLAVAKELDLANDAEFGLKLGLRDTLMAFFRIAEPSLPTGDEALKSVIGNLRDAVSVSRRGLTFLIAVNAQSGRPEFAAEISHAVARNYIKQQLDAKVDSTLASRDIIQARIADASRAVAASETAFDSFVDDNFDRISEATGRTDFASIRSEIESISLNRTQSASAAERAEASLGRQDWAAVADSLKDEAVANLERQRLALVSQLADATEGTDTAVNLRSSLAGIESQLKTAATTAVSALKEATAEAQQRVSVLRGQLRDSILSSDLPSDMLTSIYALQQNAEIARASYQTLLTRQSDLDTQAVLQVPDSRVVSAATPPGSPSFPNPRVILLLAGVVGLALGVGLALLIENFVGGFTSEQQAEAILKVPVVAAAPRQRQLKRNGIDSLSVSDALVLSPLSVYSESIRRIRVGLDQAIRRTRKPVEGEAEGLVIIVSSAAPNEGKTTTALALARAYALSGLSTLLVDCDLRKPSIHKQLGKEASEGLLEYLVGTDQNFDLKSIMTVDAGSGAQIVLGSRRSDVATDQLIAGKTLTRLIGAARKNFDIVILDTPPVGPVVDGLYLAGNADAILFVVKWSATPQQEVRAAVASLIAAKPQSTPVLVVLNQQDTNPRAYRGKYAGYYSEA